MPDVTRQRSGELLQVVFKMLVDKADGLPVKTILDAIPGLIRLTEFEKGFYKSSPDSPRFEKIIRFSTIVVVKAGWMIKTKGIWFVTDEGKAALHKYPDPEDFFREAVRLYHDWKRHRTAVTEGVTEIPGEPTGSIAVEEAEEKSREQISKYLKTMNPYDFQDLVADLLRALDYHVAWVAPPGRDQGIDIIAYTDPLGAQNPRIKVQVKRRENATAVEELRAFLAVFGNDEAGIFVSTGGFSTAARDLARAEQNKKVTLLDLDNIIDLWIEHYRELSQPARQRLPLKPVYFLDLQD